MTFLMQYLRLLLLAAISGCLLVVFVVIAALVVDGIEWAGRRLLALLGRAGGGR